MVRPPQLLFSIARRSGGRAQLALHGDPGLVCELQSSTNLEIWEAVRRVTLSDSGPLLVDPPSAALQSQFYRAILDPR